ncbi:MAG: hypothetical protein K6G72_07125 [Lachnospiraceae bacterium]|nr:hypothetical protein [Lachnospiraceae bacterium]
MDRNYYEKEINKILSEYQNDKVSLVNFYQTRIVELVLKIEDERYLMELYNLAKALATE